MKTGRVTGRANNPSGTAKHKCDDCGKNALYRVFLRDLKLTVYLCGPCSTKYVWA